MKLLLLQIDYTPLLNTLVSLSVLARAAGRVERKQVR
jgi:hypothetical protein